jgi:hypothetical protein
VITNKPVFEKTTTEKLWLTIDPVNAGDFLDDEKVAVDGWAFPETMPGSLTISAGGFAPRLVLQEAAVQFRLEGGVVSPTPHVLRVTVKGTMGTERDYDLKITVRA